VHRLCALSPPAAPCRTQPLLAAGAGALVVGVGAASAVVLSQPAAAAAEASRALSCAGALAGASGVAAGAYGFHGLRAGLLARGTPPPTANAFARFWLISVQYQIVHAAASLAAAPALLPQVGFLSGILLFSGSLQAYVLTGAKAFQYLTPFGGMALIGGWAALAAHHAGLLPVQGAADADADAAAAGRVAGAAPVTAAPPSAKRWW
jgi:uncharacterized membrane protein YgdD (TMEM256/DUF423 family)